MRIARRLLLGLPLAALLVLAVACDTGEPDTDSAASGDAVALALAQLGSGGQGIQATGNGTVAIVPDVALLTLGVETMGDSVAEARGDAAASMAAIMDVLRARGIEELDIRTSFLNISPEYSYQEILREGARINGRVLVGYRVNNSMVVKVRDLDAVGDVVDEVAEAGGNATRVDNLRFSAEDTSEARRQAREMAVKDAIERADQLASYAGETRGMLINVSESYESGPQPYGLAMGGFDSFAMEEFSTPVSAGELEIRVSVYAVFAIEGR